jgi:hypothetical protein
MRTRERKQSRYSQGRLNNLVKKAGAGNEEIVRHTRDGTMNNTAAGRAAEN